MTPNWADSAARRSRSSRKTAPTISTALRFSSSIAPASTLISATTPTTTRSANNAKFNEFGGTLGGPILHNRLFFFFGYDTIRNTGTTMGGGWYDTASLDGERAPAGSIANKFLTIKGAGVVYKSILEGPSDHHLCSDIGLIQGVNCNWIQGQGLDLGKPLTIGLGKHDPSFAEPGDNVLGHRLHPVWVATARATTPQTWTAMPTCSMSRQLGPTTPSTPNTTAAWTIRSRQRDLVAFNIYYVPVNYTSYNGPQRASNIFYHNALNYSTGLLYNHVILRHHGE